jgi:hydroxyacylglutathione hydrolase
MEHLHAVIGPLATNVYILADPRSREAIAIDTATPCLEWIAGALAEREWTLKLIVNTHGHWDHMGDNAAVQAHTGADIAIHPDDAHRLLTPKPLYAPFEVIPSVPAVEGSVCLLGADDGLLFSGDTLFPGGWGRVDFPGGDPEAMVASLARLSTLEDGLRVLPGHGAATTIGRERAWMELVRDQGRLPF